MEFRPYQQKAIDCVACKHGVPTREVRVLGVSIDGKDHVVLTPTTSRLARMLDQALKAR